MAAHLPEEADDQHDDPDDDQEVNQDPGNLEDQETDHPGNDQEYTDGNETSHNASSAVESGMLRPNVQYKSVIGYGAFPGLTS
jgi:hypothetical protein